MRRTLVLALAILVLLPAADVLAKKSKDTDTEEPKALMSAGTLSGLEFRLIGPAYNSGRITDFAVQPDKTQVIWVATASGGIWKTVNNGTTWTPIFDSEASYSIGCLAMDPTNYNKVWAGTGENNSQRSVAFGDGVYLTEDGGKSWTNMGLADSEHIGDIVIDPRDPDVVYVAAQGPLWKSGGERGLYKTTDGGATWERVLHISDDTGINEVHMDPRDPDTLYASAYQRRRHVWTLINGGPESGIYKSTDAGATWEELTTGLPTVDMGKIGMAISPANPDVIYTVIEAQRDEGGTYVSTNRGETWAKRSDYLARSPQYYNELVADPVDVDTVYSMDTWLHHTVDGGETWEMVGEDNKHVDNHAMWINPADTDHWVVGCDGGAYLSYDRGATWKFIANLPITQFYRVSVDNSKPFYYVYGGTQDNNSLGGPHRTLDSSGISNEDWFVTVGGDGYETVVDPTNPNIVYSQWQYGGLVRYDRLSGELIDIQPQEEPGEDAHRWNWDSPLMISPHSPTRLYYACQRIYRSDDHGDSWTAISGDLTQALDPNDIPVFGKIQSIDAVAKNISTSDYGNIVALTESPLVEGLIYAGTDDGLVQVTEDGGATWRRAAAAPGVPKESYAFRVEASLHDADTVYAVYNNKKMGDFSPYVYVSRDRGASWSSIAGDLPERGPAYSLIQDHVKPELLFVGTEFGVFATVNEGGNWVQLKGGLPTIQIRDMDIHRTENDLVLATFGRGFYVLDDYTPLRTITEEALEQEAILFDTRDALRYVEKTSRIGSRGHDFYVADNPPLGATFTYYLKDGYQSLTDQRVETETKAMEDETEIIIPSYDELRIEDEELDPKMVFTISDAEGNVVRRIDGCPKQGLHRVTWDLRYPSARPTDISGKKPGRWGMAPVGPLVAPGTYTVSMAKKIDGIMTEVAGPVQFEVVDLSLAALPGAPPDEALAFEQKVARLQRAVAGAVKVTGEIEDRLAHLRKAILDTPAADAEALAAARALQSELDDIKIELIGDPTKAGRNVFTPPSISDRVNRIVGGLWETTQGPTQTQRDTYGWAGEAFTTELGRLQTLVSNLESLENQLELAGAPWTPGRVPTWQPE
ncbi:MAG: hypothetical protein V2I67_09015 [Thermoanaerobaculales bacterium]|jgi:photosystem II stability/assembly factor-like uncharacterized protein|nr:hypothetical protein [Thermoanaerobaculales bacterium]